MKTYVLDHGYVEFIEAWGHGKGDSEVLNPGQEDYEVGIIEAARQSTQGSFRGWETDAKLLKRLYEHKHDTPFEFAGMIIEVQAPIFVFREWHRHRTQSYNEMSARYAPLPDLYYLPDEANLLARAVTQTTNKQAGTVSSSRTLTDSNAAVWLERVKSFYEIAEAHYQNALADGVPKELARLVMPVGHYSRVRASANLRNWLAFMTLRCDPLAQWEIQQYAGVVARIIGYIFPQTASLWTAERSGGSLV